MVARRKKSSSKGKGVKIPKQDQKPKPTKEKPQSDHDHDGGIKFYDFESEADRKARTDFQQVRKVIAFNYGAPFYRRKSRMVKDPRFRQYKANTARVREIGRRVNGPKFKHYKIATDLSYYRDIVHMADYEKAQSCLDFYHRKHGTKYELVECCGGGNSAIVARGPRIHLNFMARRADHADANANAQRELFFAELSRNKPVYCTILDESQAKKTCEVKWCPPQFAHPIESFLSELEG